MKNEEGKSKGGARAGAGRKRGVPNKQTSRVRAAIERALQADAGLTAEATKEQIRRGAFYDVRRLFDAQGNFRPIVELTESEATMIAGIEVVKRNITTGDDAIDTILKVKLIDRAKYVEMAGRHHGLFNDKLDIKVSNDVLLAKLDQARLRAAGKPS